MTDDGSVVEIKYKRFTDIIISIYLPAAIRYGIAYDTFWRLNPKIMGIYQQAYIDNMSEKQKLMNYEAWLHNQYTMSAIAAALNKKNKYPKKPYELGNKDPEIEETEENYILEMKSAIGMMNRGLKETDMK